MTVACDDPRLPQGNPGPIDPRPHSVATQKNGNDLKDYAGMNEMFQGRFGAEPPVRTTIAAPGGIPGNSLVEIDVIAAL